MAVNQVSIDTHLLPILEQVSDPEIPVLTVLDLGVIREAKEKDGTVYVKLTPTYSGCPAMDVIGDDLKIAFAPLGKKVMVELVLAPAWSTDWISESGLQKMEALGIARPLCESVDKEESLVGAKKGSRNQYKNKDRHLVSPLGSTDSKA